MTLPIHQLLGTKLNIIQAPMAGVQNWELAVAVSNAGCLGSIPCGMLTPEQVVAEIELFSAHSDKPYNLNFFCHEMEPIDQKSLAHWQLLLKNYYNDLGAEKPKSFRGLRYPFDAEMADRIEPFKPPIISFHFGLPSPELIERIKSWGTVILSSATTIEEGIWLEKHGADIIIAQGVEAGGHRAMFLTTDIKSQMPVVELVNALKSHVSVPIVAAGGIGSKQDIRKLVELGSCGVQLGTAFLLCDEAKTSEVHKAAIKSHNQITAITNVFTGRPARGIQNKVMTDLGYMTDEAPKFPYASIAMAPLRAEAESQFSGDFTPLWAGTNRRACEEISASDLLKALTS